MPSLSYLHPILAGFPFPLLVAAFLTELIAYFGLTNHWRSSAFFITFLSILFSIAAYYSGFYQMEQASGTFAVNAELITKHQALARVQLLSLIPLGLFGIIRNIRPNEVLHWLYIPFLIISLILTGATAHRGGMLVFEEGAGVVRPCQEIKSSTDSKTTQGL